MREARILFVSMPWRYHQTPNPGLSFLKALLLQAGHECQVLEAPLLMAAALGNADYVKLANGGEIVEVAFAPWVYEEYSEERAITALAEGLARAAAASSTFSEEEYRAHDLPPALSRSDDAHALARRAVEAAGELVDHLAQTVDWGAYDIVGLSCTFSQTLPSAALARRLREAHPKLRLIVGGAACDGEMGAAMMELFPFYDAAVTGRAEAVIVDLCAGLLDDPAALDLAGVILREDDAIRCGGGPAPRIPLDDLPAPNYDHFRDQVDELDLALPPTLPMEASIGCWWGQKNLCTFCGLNATSLAFSEKSPPRALAEIRALATDFGAERINFTDNILPLSYYRQLIPQLRALAEEGERYTFFVEIKTNVSRAQLAQLAAAGFDFLQPGIESLSTPILRLMKKGCTASTQVQYLKWSAELGQDLVYNILIGSPGETIADYEAMIELIPGLVHLQPPSGRGPVSLQRFSPYFDDPARYGLTEVRPAAVYQHLFPGVDDSLLRRLVYTFEFDHPSQHDPGLKAVHRLLFQALARWQAVHRPGLCTYSYGPGWVRIDDRRRAAWTGEGDGRVFVLEGLRASVYRALHRGRTVANVAAQLDVPAAEVRPIVLALAEDRLVMADEERWLALACENPRQVEPRRGRPRFDDERSDDQQPPWPAPALPTFAPPSELRCRST